MMAANTADANPRRSKTTWGPIDWIAVKRTVRRLQERIVKAFKHKEFRKVKDLQRLLKDSYHARLLAIHRVVTNKGWKTPGVDKVIWKTSEQRLRAADQLLHPIPKAPLRRIYIPKKNGKKRPLGIPTMSIRGQQALHALIHMDCLAPMKTGSSDEDFISAPSRVQGNLQARFLEEAVTAR
jgi:RNA-directed DNA polymerase